MGRCLALYRNLCPLSLSSRLFGSLDALSMFCSFIETEPWARVDPKTGLREKWDNCWKQYTAELCPAEGSCWIAILSLLDSNENQGGSYELSQARIGNLLRLRRYLTDKTVMQIPQLEQLKRFLEEMNLSMTVGSGGTLLKRNLAKHTPIAAFSIMEIEDLLYDRLIKSTEISIASLPALTPEQTRTAATLLADCLESYYEGDTGPGLQNEFKCFMCAKPADSRCSRCKSVIYCGPECQLAHWINHNKECRQ